MTNEEAARKLKGYKGIIMYPTDEAEALKDMAIQALSQEPCDDTVSIRKDVLKCRVGNIVAYNVEWLKKHWQMEMDIVCGVKPCEEAISRDAVIKTLHDTIFQFFDVCGDDEETPMSDKDEFLLTINKAISNNIKALPSVTQKSGKWIGYNYPAHECVYCSNCKTEYYEDDLYLGGSEFPKYCPNCGAKMVEPQESEDV